MNDRLWLLQVVPNVRYGRLLASVSILAVFLGWFWLTGIFLGVSEGASGATSFFAIILAYIVPVFHYITARTRDAFDQLVPHLDADSGQIDAWRRSIDHKPRRWVFVNLAIGTTAWIAHTILLYDTAPLALQGMAKFAMITGPAVVWIVMTCTLHALIDNASLFKRLARYVRIDLVNPAPLTAFARVAVISTLAIIGAQAIFPLMLIDPAGGAAAAALPGLIVMSAALAALFVLPIWPIHHEIANAKRRELARINALIAAATANGSGEAQRIADLNPYLVYRREIAAVHEWPFDSGTATRLAFYLIIPPLTWVGAALIQVVVEHFV